MSERDRAGQEKNAPNDSNLAPLLELAGQLAQLHHQAQREYEPAVDGIIRTNSRDVCRIEKTLDGLLGFADSDPCLQLYRRLCRHYWDINPVAAAEYVQAYRQMWDTDEQWIQP